jgi:hypothetical protein
MTDALFWLVATFDTVMLGAALAAFVDYCCWR